MLLFKFQFTRVSTSWMKKSIWRAIVLDDGLKNAPWAFLSINISILHFLFYLICRSRWSGWALFLIFWILMCKKQSLICLQSIFFPRFHRLFIFFLQSLVLLLCRFILICLTLFANDNHGSNKAKKKKVNTWRNQ